MGSGKAGSTIPSSAGVWVASPLPLGSTVRGHPSAAHLAAMLWLHPSLCWSLTLERLLPFHFSCNEAHGAAITALPA